MSSKPGTHSFESFRTGMEAIGALSTRIAGDDAFGRRFFDAWNNADKSALESMSPETPAVTEFHGHGGIDPQARPDPRVCLIDPESGRLLCYRVEI